MPFPYTLAAPALACLTLPGPHLVLLPLPYGPADKFRERSEGVAVRAALPAPTELQGLPLGGRMDPGEIPTLQQLGLAPLPKAVASSSGRAAAADGGLGRGGEGEALRQLRRFLAAAASSRQAGAAVGAAYGSNFASCIAPWLATGCLSPRRMLEDAQRALGGSGGSNGGSSSGSPAIAATASAPTAQKPLSWVRYELLWRDFFRLLSRKYSELQLRSSGSSKGAVAVGSSVSTPALAVAVA